MDLAEALIPDSEQRRPLERVCTLMRKQGVQRLLWHQHLECDRYFKTDYDGVHAEVRHIRSLDRRARVSVDQLTFSSTQDRWIAPPRRGKGAKPRRRDILGTCIVIRVESTKLGAHAYLFEAVFAAPSMQGNGQRHEILNTYIPVRSNTIVSMGRSKVELEAVFFCQQNSFSSVCAHSALRWAIWNNPLSDGAFQPKTSDMNRRARQVYGPSWPVGDGLTEDQCRAICKAYKTRLMVFGFDRRRNERISPYELAYMLADSALPTILVFRPSERQGRVRHMVPVVGHSINTDEWLPFSLRHYTELPRLRLRTRSKTFLPAVEWVPNLIIHDDLLGPYFALSASSLVDSRQKHGRYAGRLSAVWAVVPETFDASVSPIIAQEFAAAVFWGNWKSWITGIPAAWERRLRSRWGSARPRLNVNNLVLRTLWLPAAEYIKHLSRAVDHLGFKVTLGSADRATLRSYYPKGIWMAEISVPELYAGNRAKVGEIVLAADAGRSPPQPGTSAAPLSVRMFGKLMLEKETLELGLQSHVHVFRTGPLAEEY